MSDIKETPEKRKALKEAMLQYAKEEFPHFKRIEALTRPASCQPNKETAEAMKELEEEKGQSFETIDELMDDLNGNDKL